MNLSKNLKKILISSAALLMTGSIIGTGNVANAKHRRYHYRYARRARRNVYKYGYYKHGRYHYYKTGYFRNGKWIKRHNQKSRKRAKYMWMGYDLPDGTHYARVKITGTQYPVGKTNDPDGYQYTFYTNDRSYIDNVGGSKKGIGWANGFHNHKPATASPHNSNDSSDDVTTPIHHNHKNSVAKNLAEMKSQTVTDINNDREDNGVAPLHESSVLDQIANMRAKQEQYYQGHRNPQNGHLLMTEDASKLGQSLGDSGENLDEATIGGYSMSDHTPVNDHNGYDMANTCNDALMNHDKNSNWGHRHIILSPKYSQIGIGVSYGTSSPDKYFPYKLVEDFSN